MTLAPILLWIRRPPYTTAHFAEAVRVAGMAAALDQPVRFLFIAEGVRVLARGQAGYRLGPPVQRMLQEVVSEDRPALVHAPSLHHRGIARDDLVEGVAVRLIEDDEAARSLVEAGRTVTM